MQFIKEIEMRLFLPIFVLLFCCMLKSYGTKIDTKIRDDLERMKRPIEEKLRSFRPEIQDKFAKAMKNDANLVDILKRLQQISDGLGKRLVNGFNEMMRSPASSLKNEIEELIELFSTGILKKEPELTFLDSTQKAVQDVLELLHDRLGWLDFTFKTTMGPFFEAFEGKMSEFRAMPTIRTMFGKIIKLLERGRYFMDKWVDKQQIRKFDLFAKYKHLDDVIGAAIYLHSAIESDQEVQEKIGETMETKLGKNFERIAKEYGSLEGHLRFLLGKFRSDAKPIDEDVAEQLAAHADNKGILANLVGTAAEEGNVGGHRQQHMIMDAKNVVEMEGVGEAFNKLSLMEEDRLERDEDWDQAREWEHQVLTKVANLLKVYFAEEDRNAIRMHNLSPGASASSAFNKLMYQKTESKNWATDLAKKTEDAPLLRVNKNKNELKKYPKGFVELFMEKGHSTGIGLSMEAMIIMHIAQIQKEFRLIVKKEKKSAKDGIKMEKYEEHRTFIERMANMRLLVWSGLILHIGMQHWYLDKANKGNADKLRAYFSGLTIAIRAYCHRGRMIDAKLAKELVECDENEVDPVKYRQLTGRKHEEGRVEEEHEWNMLVKIGKLLAYYYKEANENVLLKDNSTAAAAQSRQLDAPSSST